MHVSRLVCLFIAVLVSTTAPTEAVESKCTLSSGVVGDRWQSSHLGGDRKVRPSHTARIEVAVTHTHTETHTDTDTHTHQTDVLVEFNLFKAIRHLCLFSNFVTFHLPGYVYEEDKDKCNFWRDLRGGTAIRSYAVLVHPNGTHTERVGIAHTHNVSPLDKDDESFLDDKHAVVDAYLEGEDAKRFLIEHVYSNELFRPLLFLFEMIHRFVSPAGLLSTVIDSIFDESNANFEKIDQVVFNPTGKIPVRRFLFNTTDAPETYTPTQLEKIYTFIPPPPFLFDESKPIVYRLKPIREVSALQEPITQVVAEVEEGGGERNGLSIGSVLYRYKWDRKREAHMSDRMIKLQCNRLAWW